MGLGLVLMGLELEFRFWAFSLRLWASRVHSEEVLGYLAFRVRIFSSLDFRCRPQTESIYKYFFVFNSVLL